VIDFDATFELSLNGRVIVRKNHAEYPATKDRPIVTHDDLMIIFADAVTKQLRGFYTDSEGKLDQLRDHRFGRREKHRVP